MKFYIQAEESFLIQIMITQSHENVVLLKGLNAARGKETDYYCMISLTSINNKIQEPIPSLLTH